MELTSKTLDFKKLSLLEDVVASFQLYQFHTDKAITLIPEGRFEILFQLEGRFLHKTSDDEQWKLRPAGFIGGLHTQAYQVKADRPSAYCLGVKLKAHAAQYLLQQNLNDFKNKTIDLAAVFGPQGQTLVQAVLNGSDIKHKQQIIFDFLRQRVDRLKSHPNTIPLQSIYQAGGFISVNDLAKNAHLSQSHFRKVFKERIGLAPKNICKIIRVNQAIELIKSNECQNLTALANQLGYFDQSHFIREFKSITKKSPKNFRALLAV